MSSFSLRIAPVPAKEFVIGSIAEVYQGPGIDYPVVKVLLPGDSVTTDGELGHWYRLADGTGYVSSTNLSGFGKLTKFELSQLTPDTSTTWYTSVTSVGHSGKVDTCYGGLTHLTQFDEIVGVPYYAIHYFCGGEPALWLNAGDRVVIQGDEFTISEVAYYPLSGNATNIVVPKGTDAMVHVTDLAQGNTRVLVLQRDG
jgi:hypothetical protein